MTEEQMAQMASEARLYKPRLFTIYGIWPNWGDPAFCGWGLDFTYLGQTVFYEPDNRDSHRADSPKRLMDFFQGMADIRLEYLDLED